MAPCRISGVRSIRNKFLLQVHLFLRPGSEEPNPFCTIKQQFRKLYCPSGTVVVVVVVLMTYRSVPRCTLTSQRSGKRRAIRKCRLDYSETSTVFGVRSRKEKHSSTRYRIPSFTQYGTGCWIIKLESCPVSKGAMQVPWPSLGTGHRTKPKEGGGSWWKGRKPLRAVKVTSVQKIEGRSLNPQSVMLEGVTPAY
jgi:hypothetical protein